MAKIVVYVGVYLPSNADGKVVDIDRESGRPLQSHVKVIYKRVPNEKSLTGTVHGHIKNPQDQDDR